MNLTFSCNKCLKVLFSILDHDSMGWCLQDVVILKTIFSHKSLSLSNWLILEFTHSEITENLRSFNLPGALEHHDLMILKHHLRSLAAQSLCVQVKRRLITFLTINDIFFIVITHHAFIFMIIKLTTALCRL